VKNAEGKIKVNPRHQACFRYQIAADSLPAGSSAAQHSMTRSCHTGKMLDGIKQNKTDMPQRVIR
jgi:hypothetical protein